MGNFSRHKAVGTHLEVSGQLLNPFFGAGEALREEVLTNHQRTVSSTSMRSDSVGQMIGSTSFLLVKDIARFRGTAKLPRFGLAPTSCQFFL